MAKKIIVFFLFLYAALPAAFAGEDILQIRLVIDPGKASLMPHDTYDYSPEQDRDAQRLPVAKEVVIGDRDIENIFLIDSKYTSNGTAQVVLDMTNDGRERFSAFTDRHIKERLAVICDGRVMAVPQIVFPVETGVLTVIFPGEESDKQAGEFSRRLAQGQGFGKKNNIKQREDNVDMWVKRETEYKKKVLREAARYFGENDALTVNTLKALYGQESSFGILLRRPGIIGAAGHFHLEKATAENYKLVVTRGHDQRFDFSYACLVSARHLKNLDHNFSERAVLAQDVSTVAVGDNPERKKFVLAAYNAGGRRVALAQNLAVKAGKDPRAWNEVKEFLEAAGATRAKAIEIEQFVKDVLFYEVQFKARASQL